MDSRDAQDIQDLFKLHGETDKTVQEIRASQIRVEAFIGQCQAGMPRCLTNAARIQRLEERSADSKWFLKTSISALVGAAFGAAAAWFGKP